MVAASLRLIGLSSTISTRFRSTGSSRIRVYSKSDLAPPRTWWRAGDTVVYFVGAAHTPPRANFQRRRGFLSNTAAPGTVERHGTMRYSGNRSMAIGAERDGDNDEV